MQAKLYGIGVGPGDPELLTLKAVRLLRECEVIGIPGKDPSESVAYKIAVAACPEIAEKEHLLLPTPMTKDLSLLNANYAECAKKVEGVLDTGRSVALITLGDPTVYSTYMYVQRFVVADGYAAKIVSGIPSFCAVAARFNDSLADREEQLHIIPASYDIETALTYPGNKVLMKAASKLDKVKAILQKNGQQAMMIENCGMADERIHYSTEEIPEKGSYYSLLIVKDAPQSNDRA